VSNPILVFLAVLLVALPALAAAASCMPSVKAVSGVGCAGLAGFGAVLTLGALLANLPSATITLPLGPPNQALHLAFDGLTAAQLLLLFVVGTAVAAAGAQARTGVIATPVCLAGLMMTVLGADAFAVVFGLTVAGAALWAGAGRHSARTVQFAVVLLAAFGLFIALILLSPSRVAGDFAAIRATQPGTGRTAIAFLCALLATAAVSGVVPLHAWLMPSLCAAPPPSAALLCGAVLPVAIGVLLRIGTDLVGPAPTLWWSLPPIILGALTALAGGWRGASATEVNSAVAAIAHRQTGLAMMALGLILLAKAADLPDLAVLAGAAMLILLAMQALCMTAVMLAAASVTTAAGSQRLDRLGGLIHLMPRTTLAWLGGLFGLAALPPGAGFAAYYLLIQAVIAGPRGGGPALPLLLALVVLVLALTGALAATGMVRLIGIVCLGRPRSPRAAGAREDPGQAAVPLALAGLAAAIGLMPGMALHWVAEPAIARFAAAGMGARAGLFHVAPVTNAAGYAALPLAALVGLGASLVLWLRARRGLAGGDAVPVWQDGFGPPPGWLPFGDPLTQSSGAGFLPELPALRSPLPAIRRMRVRRLYPRAGDIPSLVLAILAFAIALLAVLGLS
jgi:formate hydrogenlyase subunit 3/multisubunit Na+/H+ antiporter MnhD subunit